MHFSDLPLYASKISNFMPNDKIYTLIKHNISHNQTIQIAIKFLPLQSHFTLDSAKKTDNFFLGK